MNPVLGYPNILKEDYLAVAGCPATASKEDTIKSFIRCCPADVQVEKVRYFKQIGHRCEWHVDYNFNNVLQLADIDDKSEIFKEPHDTKIQEIGLTDHGMLKVIYTVLPCLC